jgi:hypothetical protein
MNECYGSIPLNNKRLTNRYASLHRCNLCKDRYNCLYLCAVQTNTLTKQWVIDIVKNVKDDMNAEYVTSKISESEDVTKACENDDTVRKYFVSMERENYLKMRKKYLELKTQLEVIRESMKDLGIDIDEELGVKKVDDTDENTVE